MKVKISADSTCDLPSWLLEKYDIGFLHSFVINGGDALRDGLDIMPEDMFRQVDQGGDICTTAALNFGDYEAFFRAELEEGYDAIVHFIISGDMSIGYNNGRMAAESLNEELGKEIYAIDSKNLSTGIGWQVIEAAELAAKGVSAGEIAKAAESRRELIETSFILDRLDYMAKGGRCSTVQAFGANLLGLKPCIEVKKGTMGVSKKYRGSLEKCLSAYIKERLTGRDDIDYSRIFVTYTRMDDALLQRMVDEVKAAGPWQEVLVTSTYCSVAVHSGPNCLGVLFSRK